MNGVMTRSTEITNSRSDESLMSDHVGDSSFSEPLVISVPHSAGGKHDEFEPDEQTPNTRLDIVPVKLENRGTTSQFTNPVDVRDRIMQRLSGAGQEHLAGKMATCHSLESIRRCTGCRKVSSFWNRCELFFCPICAARLARDKLKEVEWWCRELKQPKHVVLTVRNTDILTRSYVQKLKRSFSLLRRSPVFRNVSGGFYRIEITNELRGWHVHFHILVDARWVDSGELARGWAKRVGQDFAIVKVKDCRADDYKRELTKYLCKPSSLDKFTGEEFAMFIRAFTGVRTFGVFGKLYAKRTEWAEWIKTIREARPACACGCEEFKVFSPQELEWFLAGSGSNAPPTPRDNSTPTFAFLS